MTITLAESQARRRAGTPPGRGNFSGKSGAHDDETDEARELAPPNRVRTPPPHRVEHRPGGAAFRPSGHLEL